jgi:deoxyribodipyrimidine photo-lyase
MHIKLHADGLVGYAIRIAGMNASHHSLTPIPTREAALKRLAHFVPAAGRAYANRRNTDYGPEDRGNVSVLSPFIRHRLITEAEVLKAVMARHSLATEEKFVQEVFWRGYFKGHLETRPAIWSRYRKALMDQQEAVNAGGGFARAYRRATEGKTGIDCFDAWVEELVETGYLHNHTRMWFASIWIFTLKLPWELGADFTYRHFMDGDPASNTLSWRWVGGLHTRGKTYLARPDNIAEHTNGRFKPKGLAQEALPLEEAAPVSPSSLRPALVEAAAGPALLLLTEEDMHPESLPLQNADIRGILGCHAVADRSDFEVSDHALRFTDGALEDGMARAKAHFSVDGSRVDRITGDGLVQACRALGVNSILTAYMPVGPMAEQVAAARPVLARAGITLAEIRREEDDLIWPHATKGFFGLRERIPEIVARMGVAGDAEIQPDLFAHDRRAAAHRA